MRKLIAWDLVTIDGYFQGTATWDLGFHQAALGPEFDEFIRAQNRTVGTLLFGRIGYEGMASFWAPLDDETATFMNSVPKVVFSRTLTTATWQNTALSREDPPVAVARFKREPGKDLFLFGSAELTDVLEQAGLVDEYRLLIAPVALGAGTPLFKRRGQPLGLKLLESRSFATGAVYVRYAPIREAPPGTAGSPTG